MKSRFDLIPKLLLIGALFATVAAFSAAPDEPDGAAIFKQKCSMCHGPEGKGFAAIKTPDMTDPKWQKSLTDKEMEDVIKNGKKGTAMPAFAEKLKDEEITAVISFVRSLDSSKKK